MKAGELQVDDKFLIEGTEHPELEGEVFTVRRPWGQHMECWSEKSLRTYVPIEIEVKKISLN